MEEVGFSDVRSPLSVAEKSIESTDHGQFKSYILNPTSYILPNAAVRSKSDLGQPFAAAA